MSELAKLATDFLVFMFYAVLVIFGAMIAFYVVGATVEHFTP